MMTAANAINSLGLDLLTKMPAQTNNTLLSPYSIQMGFGMLFGGAAGATRDEMTRVLHYPKTETELHRSFAALRETLERIAKESAEEVERKRKFSGAGEPITLTMANRLFGQKGYEFRSEFLALTRELYNAPFEALEFCRNSVDAVRHINTWVEEETRQRIRNLISERALDEYTRLVLVNAIYLKAPWAQEFPTDSTTRLPFHLGTGKTLDMPTMVNQCLIGYRKYVGFKVVGIPYRAWELQFLIVLPDEVNGLPGLEQKVKASSLVEWAELPRRESLLYLPRFKLEPSVMALKNAFRALGIIRAFSVEPGVADFSRIAPLQPDGPLYVSDIYHKTFLGVDEKGTEAAAATVFHARAGGIVREKPLEIRIDHPFLFAIQHRASGACLFIGRVNAPTEGSGGLN